MRTATLYMAIAIIGASNTACIMSMISVKCSARSVKCSVRSVKAISKVHILHSFPLDYMKQILNPEAFEAFNHSSIFDTSVFCLGEKQGMLLNDECSSWYNRVGDFLNVGLG